MAGINSKSLFHFLSKSDVVRIITINSLVFVILQFTRVTYLINSESDAFFYEKIYNRMALPATFRELLYQPWSLITYLFSELSFTRLLGNMIWLWIFGTVIEDLKGSYRILPVYLTGGIVGGLFMIAGNHLSASPILTHYAGALAALLAVAIATLMFKPGYRFSILFGVAVRIWIFIAIFMVLTFVTIQNYTLPVLLLSLGGILTGLAYTNLLFIYFEKFTFYLRRFSSYFSNNDNFVVGKSARLRDEASKQLSFKGGNKKKSIDEILDKINERGLRSLSSDERELLDEYSKNT